MCEEVLSTKTVKAAYNKMPPLAEKYLEFFFSNSLE